jgi:tryptophanyl-tRNA synthetase
MGTTFVIPEAGVQKDTMLVPGTDGEKMSKSRNNFINIFLPEKKLRKQVMSIQTDSKELEDPKDPETCKIFALYRLLASPSEIEKMKVNYLAGGYGYGHAKQALFDLILTTFETQRSRYDFLMAHPEEIVSALAIGEQKASIVSNEVVQRVRKVIGY